VLSLLEDEELSLEPLSRGRKHTTDYRSGQHTTSHGLGGKYVETHSASLSKKILERQHNKIRQEIRFGQSLLRGAVEQGSGGTS
jgi:hypothetical protein